MAGCYAVHPSDADQGCVMIRSRKDLIDEVEVFDWSNSEHSRLLFMCLDWSFIWDKTYEGASYWKYVTVNAAVNCKMSKEDIENIKVIL